MDVPLDIREDLVTLLTLMQAMRHVKGPQILRFLSFQVTVFSYNKSKHKNTLYFQKTL